MSTTMKADVIAELECMSDEEFYELVNVDFRRRSAPDYHEALRSPQCIHRFYTVLQLMHKSIENQIAAKTAENNAKILRLETLHPSAMKLKTERASFETWRASILRVKSGLDSALIECRSLLQRRGDPYVIDQAVKDRDRARERVGVLEHAIRVHRDALVDHDAPSVPDQALWKYLPDE